MMRQSGFHLPQDGYNIQPAAIGQTQVYNRTIGAVFTGDIDSLADAAGGQDGKATLFQCPPKAGAKRFVVIH